MPFSVEADYPSQFTAMQRSKTHPIGLADPRDAKRSRMSVPESALRPEVDDSPATAATATTGKVA